MESDFGGKALRALAKRAEGLRNFTLDGKLENTSALKDLAVGAPRLETVRLCFDFEDDTDYPVQVNRFELMTEAVRIFVNHPNLMTLCVRADSGVLPLVEPVFLESVAELVRGLRVKGKRRKSGNNVRVYVEGVEYHY